MNASSFKGWSLAAGLISLLGAHAAWADPAAELAKFSAFPRVDLAALSKGEAKPVRGPSGGSSRYLSVQTAYVVPHPPATVLAKMQSWNPARHGELKVYLHGENTSDYSRLRSAPGNSAVQYLATTTAQRPAELQLSNAEAKQLAAAGGSGDSGNILASAWPPILSKRAQAFASGGSASQPAYETLSPAVRPHDELNGLLGSQGKIRQQFSSLLGGTGIGRGGGSLKPDMYWELLNADEKGVLTLGATYQRPAGDGSIQVASARYYASGGYYAGITLHQLWPVQVDGRASTLVWRGDMISSATVGSLRGIERMAAESLMIKDVARAVSLFRRDLGGAR